MATFDTNKRAAAPPLLQVKDLSVIFQANGKETEILKQLNFSLAAEETLGIVGESGSGKSVTAQTILKLIKQPPLSRMSGEIRFDGRDLLPLGNHEMQKIRGKEIGYIFQEPMTALNPVLTIGDQLAEMIRIHEKSNKKTARERGAALLGDVGIPNANLRMKSYPHELSGGMRQRAMIAMALSCNPRLLIADEPTTALDVTVQAQILDLFRHLAEKRKMALLFISHDLRVIAEIADHVLVMKEGCIVERGHIQQIFDTPSHPYTRQLLDLMPGRGDHAAH